MKNLFNTLILILITCTLQAQILTKEDIKPLIVKSGLLCLSGSFDATAEVVRINYSYFDKVFPGADPQFWDAKKSAKNKWKNGDSQQGERFFLSSTALVWTTDGYHLMRMMRNCTMVAGLTINIGDKKPFKQYLIEAVIYYFAYTAGFNLTYNLIFKMP